MLDFKNGSVFKLSPTAPAAVHARVAALLIAGEEITMAFTAVRDSLVFTNKRIIAVNVQGMTGKKVDYTSLPYSRIQAFSVETAGTFDRDAELQLWFSSLGKIHLELSSGADVRALSQMIAFFTL